MSKLVASTRTLLVDAAPPRVASCASQALALQKLCQRLAEVHGIIPDVSGRVPDGPAILVANHLGYIDPLVICSLVPCSPIAKFEIQGWPLLGELANRYAINFVERGDAWSGARALRRAWSALLGGTSVLNFPEGTTSSGPPRAFSRGIFALAKLAGVPIVPIAVSFEADLCWTDQQLFVPHYLKLLRGDGARVRVALGPSFSGQNAGDPGDLADLARTWICDHLQDLRRDRPGGGDGEADSTTATRRTVRRSVTDSSRISDQRRPEWRSLSRYQR